jgi:hypothetical protein
MGTLQPMRRLLVLAVILSVVLGIALKTGIVSISPDPV